MRHLKTLRSFEHMFTQYGGETDDGATSRSLFSSSFNRKNEDRRANDFYSGDALSDMGDLLRTKMSGMNCASSHDERRGVADYHCDINDEEIASMKTDGMDDFRLTTCLNDTKHDDMVSFMTQKFKKIFSADEYEPLIETLNSIKNTNYTNYFENSTSHPSDTGKASSFIVYWVIRYNPTGDKYSICFGISGVKIKFADQIVGYKQNVEENIVGYEPCHCGFVYCHQCPIFGRTETSVPIFKKYALSIANQRRLKDYMVMKLYEDASNVSYEKFLPENTNEQ